MATRTEATPAKGGTKKASRSYPDLQDHLKALDEVGLLVTIDEPINKDTDGVHWDGTCAPGWRALKQKLIESGDFDVPLGVQLSERNVDKTTTIL